MRSTAVFATLFSLACGSEVGAPSADPVPIEANQLALGRASGDWAYAWVTAEGTASSWYRNTSAPDPARAARTGLGTYEVSFPRLTRRGNVQVAAYGGNGRCKLSRWGIRLPVLHTRATVLCFGVGAERGPRDHAFTISYLADDTVFDPGPPPGGAVDRLRAGHLLYDPGTGIQAAATWSSMGGSFEVRPAAGLPGRWTVVAHGLARLIHTAEGSVNVTAVGTDEAYCKIASVRNTPPGPPPRDFWEVPELHREFDVRCYDGAGTPASSAFSLRFALWANFGGLAGAYAHQHRFMEATTAIDPSGFEMVGGGSPITITRSGTGRYRANLPGLPAFFSIALTGALGREHIVADRFIEIGNEHCNVDSWHPAGAGVNVNLRCYDPTGALADSPFHVGFLANEP